VKSSDVFSKRLVLKDKPPSEFKGSVVFNLAGEALAMIDEAGEIEPLSHLEGAVKNLFKNKTNLRSSLGLNYIDLSGLAQIADLPARLAEAPAQRAGQAGQDSRWQKGVVIAKDLKAPAIKKNSPAEKSGLLEGDIIISINRQELNQVNNLGDIVQDYSAGETISLVISRQGVEKEIKVILDELK
jgi:membrane-associated protease RseP (regulator of RpoE activity)